MKGSKFYTEYANNADNNDSLSLSLPISPSFPVSMYVVWAWLVPLAWSALIQTTAECGPLYSEDSAAFQQKSDMCLEYNASK